jgi:hypothetical protein
MMMDCSPKRRAGCRGDAMKHKIWLVLPVMLFASLAVPAQNVRVLPEGSEIKVRTDTAIPAKPAANSTYTATVSNDVLDRNGAVAIPRGSRAKLVAVPSDDGKDTTLDLRSFTVEGKRYSVTAPGESSKGTPGGLGANTRTAKYVGGGAVVGTVLGALLAGAKVRLSAPSSGAPAAPERRSTPAARKRSRRRRNSASN